MHFFLFKCVDELFLEFFQLLVVNMYWKFD